MALEEPVKIFCIATVANNLAQYAEMRRSLAEAGFTENRCRFVLLDNSVQNAHEPYSAINQALDEATEPYVIACHQDILLDQGPAFGQLLSQIELLNTKHPDWAVAGNSGNKSNLAGVCHVHDPNGFHHASPLPQQVQTLDENFLVIRRASGVRCSRELSGFHLYATDLCLHAAELGFSCYVLDFYFTHLSGGNVDSGHFKAGLAEFRRHWDPKFGMYLVRTPCTFFYLSRYSVVRRLLAQRAVMKLVRAGFKLVRLLQGLFSGPHSAKDSIKDTTQKNHKDGKLCA